VKVGDLVRPITKHAFGVLLVTNVEGNWFQSHSQRGDVWHSANDFEVISESR
jgi:hypothetical protein